LDAHEAACIEVEFCASHVRAVDPVVRWRLRVPESLGQRMDEFHAVMWKVAHAITFPVFENATGHDEQRVVTTTQYIRPLARLVQFQQDL
jgi:hypothetical protein